MLWNKVCKTIGHSGFRRALVSNLELHYYLENEYDVDVTRHIHIILLQIILRLGCFRRPLQPRYNWFFEFGLLKNRHFFSAIQAAEDVISAAILIFYF